MNGEAIKSFLVGLGFGVDDSSLQKFNKAISAASLKVLALYSSIKIMSAAVVYSISKISEGFEQMGYEYRIIAPAINKALVLRRELLKAYSAAGINIRKVVENSVKLNMSLTKTKFALEAIYKSVGSRFFTIITKQSDIFRDKLYKNMPKILNAMEKMIKFIFKALEATVTLGARLWSILTRVYDFFVKLDKATDGWSTIILGVVAAWKLLNLSFLATPLGMLLTGFLALLALWDDFMTFKEGGQSLINWGDSTTKVVVGITSAITALVAAVYLVRGAITAVTAVQWLWNVAMTANPIGLIIAGVTALIGLLGVLAYKMGLLKGVGDWLSNAGEKVMNFVGGENVAQNVQNNPATKKLANPVGNTSNSLTNQNVQQQTSINIMGGADALATANAVAGQQGRVNGDMVRNMKGSVR
jgi:hypothetical protein